MKPVTEMTGAELAAALKSEDETVARLKAQLEESETRKAALKNAIRERKLANYWESEWISTGLAPLQIDDKVVITQRYREWYGEKRYDTLPPNFTEAEITDLYIFERQLHIRIENRFVRLNVGISDKEIIADMRRAYLLLHPEN